MRIDIMAEALREGDASDPDNCRNKQSRKHMPGACLERCACRLLARPSLLTGNQRNRCPMVRYHSVQDADASNGPDEEQLRAIYQNDLRTIGLRPSL